jgi:glycosyltransferase involved in cell wall biosynthesis
MASDVTLSNATPASPAAPWATARGRTGPVAVDMVRSAPATGRIAVLMPVYNEPGCLGATLDSLCGQGVPFTLVLVDDGSEPALAIDVAPLDYPVVQLRLRENGGIEAALNAGLAYVAHAGFELIARVDAGDRCAPSRLVRQQAFLDANPDVHLVGSNAEWRRDDGTLAFGLTLPATHAAICRALHHTTCLLHPTVMFRTSVVEAVGPYSHAYPAAEDQEFFWRVARRFGVANIQEMLHTLRHHDGSISVRNRRRQLRTRLRLQREYFRAAEPLAYLGVAKTMALMSLPYGPVMKLKRALTGARA